MHDTPAPGAQRTTQLWKRPTGTGQVVAKPKLECLSGGGIGVPRTTRVRIPRSARRAAPSSISGRATTSGQPNVSRRALS